MYLVCYVIKTTSGFHKSYVYIAHMAIHPRRITLGKNSRVSGHCNRIGPISLSVCVSGFVGPMLHTM